MAESSGPSAPAPAGAGLFVRQSSGLVREVSVLNALFYNTAALLPANLKVIGQESSHS